MRYAVQSELGLFHVLDRWQGVIVATVDSLAEANALIFAMFEAGGGVTRFRVAIYADHELLSTHDAGEAYAAAVLLYQKTERAPYIAAHDLTVELEHYIHGKWAPVGGSHGLREALEVQQ